LVGQEEMEYFKTKHVWQKRLIQEVVEMTGKQQISVKWVDSKGDDVEPSCRSLLLAREMRRKGEDRHWSH